MAEQARKSVARPAQSPNGRFSPSEKTQTVLAGVDTQIAIEKGERALDLASHAVAAAKTALQQAREAARVATSGAEAA